MVIGMVTQETKTLLFIPDMKTEVRFPKADCVHRACVLVYSSMPVFNSFHYGHKAYVFLLYILSPEKELIL